MTTKRELPDGTTITYTSAGRLWERPDGDLLSVNYGPWEPVETLVEAARATFPDQTCPACRLEHPGTDCQQPDLFGGEM